MTDSNKATDGPDQRRSWPVLAIVSVITALSIASTYPAVAASGQDVLGLGPTMSRAFTGIVAFVLVLAAVGAHERAAHNESHRVLLVLMWVLSACFGIFAGTHELINGHAGAAAFKAIAMPIVALQWHLVVVGDRHIALQHRPRYRDIAARHRAQASQVTRDDTTEEEAP